MNIGERIKKLRIKHGFTQVQLSEIVGIAQQSLQKIESGVTKNPKNVEKFANTLNCSPEYLQFGVGSHDGGLDDVSLGPEIKKAIPLIDFVQAGNWGDINEIKETQADYGSSLVCPVNCSNNTFALRVVGVSMEPKFFSGDLIFVDPDASYGNGSFVVARLDDENQATFKQLVIEGDHKFLKPLNKDWPEQLIPINGNCTIVGKVVFTGKEL